MRRRRPKSTRTNTIIPYTTLVRSDGGNEPSRDLVGQALDRCPRTRRIRYHLDDARQQRVAADLLGADDERAALVDRSSDDHIADRLRDGHRLARDHRLVTRGSALLDLALDRHPFARPNTETTADSYPIARHPLLLPVGPNAARGPGGARSHPIAH